MTMISNMSKNYVYLMIHDDRISLYVSHLSFYFIIGKKSKEERFAVSKYVKVERPDIWSCNLLTLTICRRCTLTCLIVGN